MNTQFTNGYALLIAVNENKVPNAALPAVAKDVDALYEVLVHPERCAYPHNHVKLIKGKDATRDGILSGLAWLQDQLKSDASGNATAVIYYTGHGHIEGGNYYLVPYDIDLSRLRTTSIRAEDFAEDVSNLKPQRLLVVLDCCHSAGMEVKDFATLTDGLSSTAIPAKLFMPGEQGISPEEGAKGFEQLALGSGRAVLNSSQASQSSWVRKDKKMSIFTYHLIEALTGHAQPQDGASEVLISDVMSHVWRRVPDSAKADWDAEQQPDYQVSGNFPMALLLGGKGLSKGELAPDPLEPPQSASVDTDGGNVSAGRDFVGRDRIVQGDDINVGDMSGNVGVAIGRGARASVNQGVSPRDLEPLFATLLASVAQHTSAEKRDAAVQKVEELKQEVAKGKDANDSRIATIIDGLTAMVPGAVGAVVSTFASPILGGIAGPVTRFVLGKIKGG